MAATVETTIAEALMEKLAALVLTPALPIAWPNVTFDPPADGKWLRVNDLPAPTRGLGLAGDSSSAFTGILQVDVMWPLGAGVALPKDAAGAVTAHFARGTRLDRDGIRVDVSDVTIGPALRDDPAWMIPVSISYRALVAGA